MRAAAAVIGAFMLAVPGAVSAQDRTLNLELGDAARRGRETTLRLDVITDTATGAALSPAELAGRLADVRLLFVGENHTSLEFHNAQRRLIEELSRAGRQVLIGLEMYPSPEQPFLNQWVEGLLTEDGFLALSRWYRNWGYNWRYYRDIFLFARDRRIRMFAVNAPREIVTAVRMKGFDGLSPEQAALVPARVDTGDADHRALFKAYMDESGGVMAGMAAEMFDGMFRAQCTWDATMAHNAVQALETHGGPNAIMVVLIGSGHVAYGLGAERQAALWFKGRTASVIPVPVTDGMGRPQAVRASYANYVWGVMPELAPAYPSLGVSFRDATQGADALPIISVERASAAAAAGVMVGDQLASFDGVATKDRDTVNRLVADKRWGDTATLVVRRAGTNLTLVATFVRRLPAAPPTAPPGGGEPGGPGSERLSWKSSPPGS